MKKVKWLTRKVPLVGLSPMDGITDEAFRLTQCQINKPDLIFTEFVSAEGLAHSAIKLFDHLLYSPQERPIIGQLFGKDPNSFYFAALILCHLGFDGIDINLGCPAKRVTQHGSGAALIDNPKLAKEIILSVKKAITDYQENPKIINKLKLKKKFEEAIQRNQIYSKLNKYPTMISLSVKTRLGINQSVVDSWIPFLADLKPDFITLHGRTLKQAYAGQADWDQIKQATKLAHEKGVLLFGNGDLKSRQMATDYCQKFNTDGALIGRAAMGNPWVFSDHQANFKEKYHSMLLHAQNYQKIYPTRPFDPLRRHFLLYVSGHPHASDLRQKIVTLSSVEGFHLLEADIGNC